MAEEKKPDTPEPKAKKGKKDQGIISLSKGMLKMTLAMSAASLITKTLLSPIKVLTSLPGLANKLVGSFGGLIKAFSGLDISLANVGKAFSSGLSSADALQERALGMGKDLGGFVTEFSGQTDKMAGVLSSRLGTTMDMFDKGLRGNTLRVAQLAQLQKLSGRDSKALISSFSNLQSSMGLSNAELNNLAAATIKAQYTYGVNAEKMVTAMNALSQETKDVGLMEGLGDEFAGAMGEVTSMLGGQGEKEVSKILRILTGGAKMDMEAARLGLTNIRNQFNSNMSQKKVVDLILSSVKVVEGTTKRWQSSMSGLKQMGRVTEVLTENLSKSIPAFKAVTKMLKVEGESKAKNMKMGANIMATLKQQALALWEPISNLWLGEGAKLYNMVVKNATEIGLAFRAYIVNPIKDIIQGFTGSLLENDTLMEGLKKVFKTVGAIISWVANTLGKTFGGEGGTMYSKVVGFFSKILLFIADGFDDFVLGALPAIELAFLTVASVILRALNKVMDIDQSTIDALEERRAEAKYRTMSDEDVDALVTGITRGKDEFASKYDVGGALGGAAIGAGIGSVVPIIGTLVGAIGGGLIGWFAGDKLEEAIEGTFGKFWITHPITGAEEAFKTHEEAAARGLEIQAEVRAEVAKRRESMSMGDKVRLMQEKMLAKEEKTGDEQLDYLALIAGLEEDIVDNTQKEEDMLEVVPGTDFQNTMGAMLSTSILHVLKAAQESANAEMLTVQQEILDKAAQAEIDRKAGNENKLNSKGN